MQVPKSARASFRQSNENTTRQRYKKGKENRIVQKTLFWLSEMLPSLLEVIPKYFVVVAEANAASLKSMPKEAKKAKYRN